MSPSLTNEPIVVPESEDDVQFQKWLKELDNAEELMDDLEAKTAKLDAKMDALLNSLNDMNSDKNEPSTGESNTKSETASDDKTEPTGQ
ncbi:hypothetical protein BCR42DRAFT_405671 [Absidia repens]|uniref:Uncharacterized protein n=1 Tax=Absidia repens TaxID=90262 RepID=A0A1X2ITU6_9FUNG|nr:hypothetical protein BCR42DRAFT_405671 [Absidia repens]